MWMNTFCSTLLLFQADPIPRSPKDAETKLRTAWPVLLEAWKAINEFRSTLQDAAPNPRPRREDPEQRQTGQEPLTDAGLRAVGRMDRAFEEAGLWETELSADFNALKQIFKARLSSHIHIRTHRTPNTEEEYRRIMEEYQNLVRDYQSRRQGGLKNESVSALEEFEAGIADMVRHHPQRAINEDLFQDAVSQTRKGLKELKILREESPLWLRNRVTSLVRALTLGESFPEPPKPTPEQSAQIDDLLDRLSDEDPSVRDEAQRKLLRLGELSLPQMQKRCVSTDDPELLLRLRAIVGNEDRK